MADDTRAPAAVLRAAQGLFRSGAALGVAAVALTLSGYWLIAWLPALASVYCLMEAGSRAGWWRGWTARDGAAASSDAHPWQEYNAHGNTCHYPGYALTEGEHDSAGGVRG